MALQAEHGVAASPAGKGVCRRRAETGVVVADDARSDALRLVRGGRHPNVRGSRSFARSRSPMDGDVMQASIGQ